MPLGNQRLVRVPVKVLKLWNKAEHEVYKVVPPKKRHLCAAALVEGVAIHALLEYIEHGGIRELVKSYLADPTRVGFRYVDDDDDFAPIRSYMEEDDKV